MTISLLLLLFIGFLAGLSNGLVGIGGGVFAVPILTIVGVDHSIAVACAANLMISGAYSSFRTYLSKSMVDFKLAFFLISGGFMGVSLGAFLVDYWLKSAALDQNISVMLLVVLVVMSITSALSLIRKRSSAGKEIDELKGVIQTGLVKKSFFKKSFVSFDRKMPILTIILLGLVAGFLTPVLGIGGSIVMLPVLLNILKINPNYVTGTINLHVLTSAILATIFHFGIIDNSNFAVALVLILGTVVGSQIGARFGAKINAKSKLKIANAVLLIITLLYILFGQIGDAYNFDLVDVGKFDFFASLKGGISYAVFCVGIAIIIGQISYYIGSYVASKGRRKRVKV